MAGVFLEDGQLCVRFTAAMLVDIEREADRENLPSGEVERRSVLRLQTIRATVTAQDTTSEGRLSPLGPLGMTISL